MKAKNFDLQDKYGGTQKLRFQTSQSSSSNYKAKSVQFDRADYGALINLANKARKVKEYSYYNFTNNSNGNGATNNSISGLTKVTKAAGVADPISLSDVTRGYVANTNSGFGNEAIITGLSDSNSGQAAGLVVAPGGFAQNNDAYGGVYNYLIAEYGSLSEQAAQCQLCEKSCSSFCA